MRRSAWSRPRRHPASARCTGVFSWALRCRARVRSVRLRAVAPVAGRQSVQVLQKQTDVVWCDRRAALHVTVSNGKLSHADGQPAKRQQCITLLLGGTSCAKNGIHRWAAVGKREAFSDEGTLAPSSDTCARMCSSICVYGCSSSKSCCHSFLLQGIVWWGAESARAVPGGLERRSIEDLLAQLAHYGFNAIKLPFLHQHVLFDDYLPAASFDARLNPMLMENGRPLKYVAMLRAIARRAATHGITVWLVAHSLEGLWYSRSISELTVLDSWSALARQLCPQVSSANSHGLYTHWPY